jgi:hypothetical protein
MLVGDREHWGKAIVTDQTEHISVRICTLHNRPIITKNMGLTDVAEWAAVFKTPTRKKKAISFAKEVKIVWRLEDTIIKLTVISTVPLRSRGGP